MDQEKRIAEVRALTDDEIERRVKMAEAALVRRGVTVQFEPEQILCRVAALERILIDRGLATAEEIEREAKVSRVAMLEEINDAAVAAVARQTILAPRGPKLS